MNVPNSAITLTEKEAYANNSNGTRIDLRNQYRRAELIELNETTIEQTNYLQLLNAKDSFIKDCSLIKKDQGEPAIPYVTTLHYEYLSGDKQSHGYCSGKGLTLEDAKRSAVGEAVERYCACNYSTEELIYSPYESIKENALDPRQLVLYSSEQYEKISWRPFREDAMLGWVKAYSFVQDKSILVPAMAVFLDYQLQNEDEYFVERLSTGLAAGPSLLRAIVSAALEVIERDAFMISWYNKLPCSRIDARTIPNPEIVEMIKHYEQMGNEIYLLRLNTDAPCHVFMAIARQSTGEPPFISVGLGADFSSTIAANKALLELGQVRASSDNYYKHPVTLDRINQLKANPDLVDNINDHRLLYASRGHEAAFEFLFNSALIPFEWDSPERKKPRQQFEELIGYLNGIGSDLIYYNLSLPVTENSGYYSCRVILPGFQPLHFGYHNLRLAGKRLFELPVKLGFRNKASTPTELNSYPHPLA